MDLRLRTAEAMAHAAIFHAESLGVGICVAVCGEGGRIVAFLKMDGTDAMSGHEAMRRAMTAAGAGVPSQFAGEGMNASTSASMEGIGLSRQAGGLPVMCAGRCVGGVGVCGGTLDEAVACARAALTTVSGEMIPV